VPNTIDEWRTIPRRIQTAIRGLDDAGLDARGGDDGWSIRETVHHLIEANLVASNMILAALGTDAHAFDWTWLQPDRQWMRRLGYDRAAIRPAINLLRALGGHVAELLSGRPAAMSRRLLLRETPDGKPRPSTVGRILAEEVAHARGHLAQIRTIRNAQ
jgi:hypothetical protein